MSDNDNDEDNEDDGMRTDNDNENTQTHQTYATMIDKTSVDAVARTMILDHQVDGSYNAETSAEVTETDLDHAKRVRFG